MNYKDLNVYQRAYSVAIDLHKYLDDNKKISQDKIQKLKDLARNVIGNIAEGYSQRTPEAKRYFNFKTLKACHRIMLDLDFLHGIQLIEEGDYNNFFFEYETVSKQIYKYNQCILEEKNKKKK